MLLNVESFIRSIDRNLRTTLPWRTYAADLCKASKNDLVKMALPILPIELNRAIILESFFDVVITFRITVFVSLLVKGRMRATI